MEKQKKEALSGAEQEVLSKALILLINQFPDKPQGVTGASYQFISDKEPLAVFSMQSAVKLEEYLCMPGEEKFDGQFSFYILYRCKPTTTPQRISKQDFLDRLGEWLEMQEYPKLTGNRTITRIERTTTTFLSCRYENGMEDYQCNFNLIYEKR